MNVVNLLMAGTMTWPTTDTSSIGYPIGTLLGFDAEGNGETDWLNMSINDAGTGFSWYAAGKAQAPKRLLTLNNAGNLGLINNITLPTTYSGVPASTELGGVLSATPASSTALTSNTWTYGGASLSLSAGVWLVRGQATITGTSLQANSWGVTISTSTGVLDGNAANYKEEVTGSSAKAGGLTVNVTRVISGTSASTVALWATVTYAVGTSVVLSNTNTSIWAVRIA
jgi:hypothetical protein